MSNPTSINSQSYLSQGKYQISGSVSYLSQTIEYPNNTIENEEFRFAPIFSYLIIDHFSLGLELSYNYYNHNELDYNYHPDYHNTLSLGSVLRYYILNEKLTPFVECGYNFILIDLEEGQREIDEQGYRLKIGAGLNYFFTNKVAVEPSITYVYKSTIRDFMIEGNYEEHNIIEKNVIVELKLNYFIN